MAYIYAYTFEPTVFVFDCGGVLTDARKLAAIREIGTRNLLPRLVANRFSFKKVYREYLEALRSIKPKSDHQIMITDADGQELPEILCEWMLGTKSCNALLAEIEERLSHYSYSSKSIKALTQALSSCMLEPEKLLRTQKLNTQVVEFMQEIYTQKNDDGSRRHRVYILSNYNQEAFDLLLTTFPVIRNNCDGWFISGGSGSAKPATRFYTDFLHEKQISSNQRVVFIDDQQANREAAAELGWICFEPSAIYPQLPVGHQTLVASY